MIFEQVLKVDEAQIGGRLRSFSQIPRPLVDYIYRHLSRLSLPLSLAHDKTNPFYLSTSDTDSHSESSLSLPTSIPTHTPTHTPIHTPTTHSEALEVVLDQANTTSTHLVLSAEMAQPCAAADAAAAPAPSPPSAKAPERRLITSAECFEELGYCFSPAKKWATCVVVVLIQISMNFNTSVYPSAIPLLMVALGMTLSRARGGMAGCLTAYGIGSELWAPWSEEFGRKRVMQLSLGLVNVFQVVSVFAPSGAVMVTARTLLGLSSGGGSVTLGIVADMFTPIDQQQPVAFVVFSSVLGASIGPVIGGYLQQFCKWQTNFYIQLGLGLLVQFIHAFSPETRSSILMDRIAKKRRENPHAEEKDRNLYGPNEMREGPRISMKEIVKTWIRPFRMFVTEPIVLCLSLLSGFSDALIFTFMEGFTLVFGKWDFSPWQIGLCFTSILIGYFMAWGSFCFFFARDRVVQQRHGSVLTPERRLYWLLWLAPLEATGLFIFAASATGPPVPWIIPQIASAMVGIANYAIYMATIDYMVAAYGPYAASATGGNALARDVLAGVASMYAGPMFENSPGSDSQQTACLILAVLAACVTIPIYLFYWKGEWFRNRSPFAQALGEGSESESSQNSVAGNARDEEAAG